MNTTPGDLKELNDVLPIAQTEGFGDQLSYKQRQDQS